MNSTDSKYQHFLGAFFWKHSGKGVDLKIGHLCSSPLCTHCYCLHSSVISITHQFSLAWIQILHLFMGSSSLPISVVLLSEESSSSVELGGGIPEPVDWSKLGKLVLRLTSASSRGVCEFWLGGAFDKCSSWSVSGVQVWADWKSQSVNVANNYDLRTIITSWLDCSIYLDIMPDSIIFYNFAFQL